MQAESVGTAEKQQRAFYDWTFPGAPVRVHLRLDVVQRLEEYLAQELESMTAKPPARRGLLLGGVSAGGTEIIDFQPLVSVEPAEVLAIAALFENHGVRPVGYYRAHGEGEEKLCLDSEDLALARACFSDPNCVFLVVCQTAAHPASAGFFFWDREHIDGDFCFLEFPFEAQLLAEAKQDKVRRHPQTPGDLRRGVDPVAESDGKQRGRGWRRAAWFVVGAVLLGASGFWVVMFFAQRPVSVLRTGSRSAAPAAPVANAAFISLRAERQGADLTVSWDHGSSIVRSAETAKLTIEDGATRETVLDRKTLQFGSVLYIPTTDQVLIQLEIAAPEQKMISESVLVLLNRQDGGARVTPLSKEGTPRFLLPVPDDSGTAVSQASKASVLKPKRVFQFREEKEQKKRQPAGMIPPAPLIAPKEPTASIIVPSLPSPLAPPQPAPAPRVMTAGPTEVPKAAPSSSVPLRAAIINAFTPPVVLRAPSPPRLTPAQRAFITRPELVEFKVYVDALGKVDKVEPSRKANPMLVNAVLSTVRLWRFRPARRGWQDVPGEIILQFKFDPAK